MNFRKIDVNKSITFFLLGHLIIWTLVPSISNINLPLDTVEAFAWSTNMNWGFDKHPPLSAFFVSIFYQIFGNQDWAYYFLSQIFVISTFFIIFKFSENFFKKPIYSLLSVLLLEGIYFYNFTTPEFNVNICQFPFWGLTVLYFWKGFKDDQYKDWLLFGLFAALGILSKYLFIYLLLALDIFCLYFLIKKKISYKCLISLFTFLLVLTPHLIWLTQNDYITVSYGLHRTGTGDQSFLDHFTHPLIFLGKQVGIIIPFLIMFSLLISKTKTKFKFNDKKLIFLLSVNIIPLVLIFVTSMLMGIKIRTMWMSPFYLCFGVLFLYMFANKINLNKLKYFFSVFLILFVLSPSLYLYVSISQNDKRTDYEGKKISISIQEEWNKNFKNEIKSVIGDEWHAGNLSYHLKSRPKWYSHSNAFKETTIDKFIETIGQDGFIIVNGKCLDGISLKIKNKNICMYGKK